ncbi:MAG: HAMP domain-containing histidine kinase [Anaerolineae bacterium]|nr:HAMP domain-containing histidine kinase [Anaerolineae bacterium]
MTLRLKLILLYAALLTIIIVSFGIMTFAVIRATWIESVDQTLRETANLVINNAVSALVGDFGGPQSVRVILPSLDTFRASGVMVQAWQVNQGEHPQFVTSSANVRNYDAPFDPAALGSDTPVFSYIFTPNNVELRVLTAPVSVTGHNTILGNVQVAASLYTINQATDKLALLMFIGGVAGVLISILLGAWLSHQALSPIGAITKAADSITTAKDLLTRLPTKGHKDELGQLTAVLNRMLDRIEHLFSVQHRFVADVSHELRTPLTAIRGNLEIIERYGLDPDSLDAIKSESERMSRLVSDLLLLARADYGGMKLDLMPVDLDSIVTDIYHEGQILVKDRALAIKINRIEPARIMGNPDRLKQLLLNLLSNAIHFTPDGGQITFSLGTTPKDAYLRVADTGIGISPEDQKRIFDRFYQADASRVKQNGHEGTGLGLSIVQWIAEAHNGEVSVQSALGAGTTFTIRIPLMQMPPIPDDEEDAEPSNLFPRPRLTLARRKRHSPDH